DAAINGKWVNSQGQLIDNGLDNFQYIIVMPYFFDTESADTVFGMRKALGNNIPPNYRRDDTDQDGTEYDAGDIDAEYFTVKTYDATGWPSTPKGSWRLLNKGSGSVPTTVIVTGAFLSIGNGAVRTHLTEAAVKAILSKAGTKSGAESPFSVDGTTSNGGCGCSITGRSTVVESPAGTALMLVGLFVVWFRGLLKRR
ncbi:MAG: hypothetical protein GY850_11910, partial [bacterium]|nr:hypothetical protein [bacterium]